MVDRRARTATAGRAFFFSRRSRHDSGGKGAFFASTTTLLLWLMYPLMNFRKMRLATTHSTSSMSISAPHHSSARLKRRSDTWFDLAGFFAATNAHLLKQRSRGDGAKLLEHQERALHDERHLMLLQRVVELADVPALHRLHHGLILVQPVLVQQPGVGRFPKMSFTGTKHRSVRRLFRGLWRLQCSNAYVRCSSARL